eukprot:4155004-Pyramimonas_sp.AAC.1
MAVGISSSLTLMHSTRDSALRPCYGGRINSALVIIVRHGCGGTSGRPCIRAIKNMKKSPRSCIHVLWSLDERRFI